MRDLPGTPFKLQSDDAMIADVRARVAAARFPTEQAGADWETGTPLSYMRRLQDYWLNSFDWTVWVDRINAFEQRMVDVEGETIHVIVERGSGENPMPLLMTSGWPGSFVEFLDIIDPLAHPERHGGRVEDAFTVIIPSLPGYGLSPAPSKALSPVDIAPIWSGLMTRCFDVDHYVAYGSDWGSAVTTAVAFDHPERLRGIMQTMAGAAPDLSGGPALSAEEKAWLGTYKSAMAAESAYQAIQGTKPQSLAYAQTDSPIGLAAWVIEKFQGWTVPGTRNDPPFSMDVLLANIMLYWISGPLAPSWLYMFLSGLKPRSGKARVPATFMVPPGDLFAPPPRAWFDRMYDVIDYSQAGIGHFPGLDSPDTLVAELRRMLLPLGRREP